MSEEHSSASHDSDLRSVLRGSIWNTIGQFAPTGITVFLTPYVLHGLGVERYGLFVLTASLVAFLNTFDGGIRNTAQRYFGVYAGEQDAKRTTELLVTLVAVLALVGVGLSVAGWFIAEPVISILKMSPSLRPQAVFLLRTLGVLLMFGFFHNLFVAILSSHNRYSYITKGGFVINAVWAVGMVLTVHFGWGLRGVALVFVSQQILLAVIIVPAALTYCRSEHVGFLPRPVVREFLGFSGRVQLSNLAYLINDRFDSLVIGAALSVRKVSFYNAGSSFSENVGGVAYGFFAPIQTSLTNAFGRGGLDEARPLFDRFQRLWMLALTGLFATSIGASWFAITIWLGSGFSLGGQVAMIALAETFLFFSCSITRTYCTAVGQPGLESRFGFFTMGVNVVLTIPLVFLGVLGVVAGTAAAQLLGTFFFLRLVRREVHADLVHPLRLLPVLPAVVAGAAVAGLEAVLHPFLPHGGLGLILSGIPVAIGMALFATIAVGPTAALAVAKAFYRKLRGGPFVMPDLAIRS